MASREALVTEILERVGRLEEARLAAEAQYKSNREHNIGVIHFVVDTIKTVDPKHIEVGWMGSYDNSGVHNYPTVEITARMKATHARICGYSIYGGGNMRERDITTDEIIANIAGGLKALEENQNRRY